MKDYQTTHSYEVVDNLDKVDTLLTEIASTKFNTHPEHAKVRQDIIDSIPLLWKGLKHLEIVCFGIGVTTGWWHDIKKTKTMMPLDRNVGEMIALEHSELSEALEGFRRNKMDDHLPHRTSEEVELADAVIRIFDHARGRGLDITGAIIEKQLYNTVRADHKVEARQAEGGKAI